MKIRVEIPNRFLVAAACVACGVVGFGVARAAIPADANALTYTGVLVDNGVPVDGSRAITVTLFPDPSSTTPLTGCPPSDQAAATVVQGRFSAKLDAGCVVALHANPSAVVEVKVGDVPVGARTPIGAVPFALEAEHAASADVASGVSCTGCIDAQNLADFSVVANEIATGAVTEQKIADGAVTQVEAPFAPTVFDGFEGAPRTSPIVFDTSIVQVAPGGRADQTIDVVTISLAAAHFQLPPTCTAADGDAKALAGTLFLVKDVSASSVVVEMQNLGAGIPDGAPYRINLICVGQ